MRQSTNLSHIGINIFEWNSFSHHCNWSAILCRKQKKILNKSSETGTRILYTRRLVVRLYSITGYSGFSAVRLQILKLTAYER